MTRRGWPWRWSSRAFVVPFVYYDGFGQLDRYEARWVWFGNQLRNLWSWLRYAHDCQDPRVGCSCAGSYRFPSRVSNPGHD